jgi:hypothetical protein
MEDLWDGRRFYEEQQAGLGAYFLESLFADIDSLKLSGGIHRQVFGCHRMLSERFPYFIYYRHDGEKVFVKAVLDCRRHPGWIRSQLKQRRMD